MSLRILGGRFRARTLKSPKGEGTRPTLAILRKAVFDILQQEVPESRFLDLFAGSGAMGLEALSRGALHATFVEKNPAAFRLIQENVRLLSVENESTLYCMDAELALKKMTKAGELFDVIYIDPPYAKQSLPKWLQYFDTSSLLSPGGTLLLEEGAPSTLGPLVLSRLTHVSTRTFSRSTLHQFRALL
ncbi:MAG: 16S rRNA (guanine(966)-N(2))-methyltransferase RsmD [Verrucomicrobia bacterium]|nr:16S rRNA (guanine(966)-N(2))-methyltransferase RsmD [Verrucomicrobiota bacterium]